MPAKPKHVLARCVGQSTGALVLALCLAGCEDNGLPDVPDDVAVGEMSQLDREYAEKLVRVRNGETIQPEDNELEKRIRTSVRFDEVKCENVVVPTVDEFEVWVAMLKALDKAPLRGERDFNLPAVRPETAFLLQMSMTMNLLPYCRSDFMGARYRGFKPEGTDEVNLIEAQFMGIEHEPGDRDTTAFLVAYIVSLKEGGFGLTLAYKGTSAGGVVECPVPFPGCSVWFGQDTNDWYKNWDAAAGRLFVGDSKIQVHRGFLEYKRSLDRRMEKSDIPPHMNAILKDKWNVRGDYKNFWQLVTSFDWKWCVCVGHSLGGGMAGIAAATLSVPHPKKSADKGNVYEVVVAAPLPGNQAFANMMSEHHVRPHGGLRIDNDGDEVPSTGLQLHKGVPNGIRWKSDKDVSGYSSWFRMRAIKQHLHFEIEENNLNHRKQVFTFPYSEDVHAKEKDQYYKGWREPEILYDGVCGLHVPWALVAVASFAFSF